MTTRLPCSRCATTRDIEVIEREEKVTIKGKEITFVAHFSRCTACGEEFEGRGQLDANLDAAREAYARLYESPSPEALVALRSRYGASQKAFGAILGFGELTMNSYEKGSSPDPTNRLLLKLAADPCIFKAMYDINKGKIGAIQRRRIEDSEGFQEALCWSGLGALSSHLTQLQQEKVEACAERNDRTIPEQIAVYVGSASFQDYSRLYTEACWPDEAPAELPSAIVQPSSTQGAA
ncbi:MAG TPA: type II TA system antitoxin MqsA family protein [Rectinemataceae bacterium]|nr:type II TA system antitoxin MqsA family protein [Rectinemataceae bacterium]